MANSEPGSPKTIKHINKHSDHSGTEDYNSSYSVPISKDLVNNYSKDIAELRRYSYLWTDDMQACE